MVELGKVLNISTRAVEKQVAKLQSQGKLERFGPKKGGKWKVIK